MGFRALHKKAESELAEIFEPAERFIKEDLENFRERYKQTISPLIEFLGRNEDLLKDRDQQALWTCLFNLSLFDQKTAVDMFNNIYDDAIREKLDGNRS